MELVDSIILFLMSNEQPIQLVYLNGDQFEVNKQAVDIIKHLPGPIIAVSVAGNYRTGKVGLSFAVIPPKWKF